MNSDRFIPSSDIKNRHFKNMRILSQSNNSDQNDPQVAKLLKKIVINGNENNQKMYNSSKLLSEPIEQENNFQYLNKFGIDISNLSLGPSIISKPDRILQALSLSDNYYLNLLDCSSDSVLAVGLSRGIYLWKPKGTISRIRQSNDVACIQWNPSCPQLIACGTKNGAVQIWNAEQNKCIIEYTHHEGRVGSLSWFNDPNCFISGSKDSNIYSYDTRFNRKTAKYRFHTQQICSLKVQPFGYSSGSCLFASGSNDKNLIIWNTRMKLPELVYKHSAAVKGIAWHPTKNGIIASGGGTEDRSIKIWNISSNELVKTTDTGSQVCNLMYIKDGQKLVSTHGFNKFQTNIWQSASMTKTQTLIGHTKRVLYLAAQPNGQTIITGAGDQTIRFWKLKQEKKKQKNQTMQQSIMTIR